MMRLLVIAFVLALVACSPSQEDRIEADAFNKASLSNPRYVGCLPDGRAVFVAEMKAFHPGHSVAQTDRLYMTLDGEATVAIQQPSGKSTVPQSVFWPGTGNTVPGDPCALQLSKDVGNGR